MSRLEKVRQGQSVNFLGKGNTLMHECSDRVAEGAPEIIKLGIH